MEYRLLVLLTVSALALVLFRGFREPQAVVAETPAPVRANTATLATSVMTASTATAADPKAGAKVGTQAKKATGVVFHDANANKRYDDGERRLAGVRVSNGVQIVRTDASGRYELPVGDDTVIFVIKPRGWRTPLSKHGLPRFYYIHNPAGSPATFRYKGVAPTGPLPDAIDFPLYPQEEPDTFKAVMFGDPQPRDQKEIDYIAHDVVQELVGTDAAFGVTLGDILFDNLSLFESQARTIGLIGIPWYNVVGNHDINFDAKHDGLSNETFKSNFGPPYYSFDYGPVHFLVLDDVEWFNEKDGGKTRRGYRAGLGEKQMRFIRADLKDVPDEKLVVLMMHIPLPQVRDRQELFRLIEKRRFCMSISGHTHHHEHRYITKKDGWQGPKPHHHVINVTVSGSWWSGAPDERGIPHTTMADGAPNGYSIMTFDGSNYTLDFKAAGRPADHQMQVAAPDQVSARDASKTDVYANVFNGSEKSSVKMRLGSGPWITMNKVRRNDPSYEAVYQAENALPKKNWRNLPKPKASSHLWQAKLPKDPEPGTHLLHVETTDMHGRTYTGRRVIRILE